MLNKNGKVFLVDKKCKKKSSAILHQK